MKKIKNKAILFVLCMSLVIGTSSVGYVRAPTMEMTVFNQENSNWDHKAIKTIIIPCFQEIVSIHMTITAYYDPDDYFLRAVWFDLDGRGGWIGTYRFGPHDVRGNIIEPGQTLTWTYDMSNCQFAGEWDPNADPPLPDRIYYDFIHPPACETVGFFSTGEHTITAYVSSQDVYMGKTQDSWITIILDFEYTEPCVVGSLFSDALGILPLAVLASTLVVLRKRK